MKVILKISDKELVNYISAEDVNDISDIWILIKNIINVYQVEYPMNWANVICQRFLSNKIIKFDEFQYHDDKELEGVADYVVDVSFKPSVCIFRIYHARQYISRIISDEHRYVFDYVNNGNCIDDFIICGINPLLDIIQCLVYQISDRQTDRNPDAQYKYGLNKDYHQTSCYENDFMQISKIRDIASKLVQNCNHELECMSEKYTK